MFPFSFLGAGACPTTPHFQREVRGFEYERVDRQLTRISAKGGTMASETAAAENPMEARIARLESDIGHLRSDVTEIKVGLRSLRDQFVSRVDRLAEQTDNRFDSVIAKLDGLGGSVASTRIWTLTFLVTFAAMVFGTMARGFGWI